MKCLSIKQLLLLCLIGLTLSSCSLLRIHKMPVEQGNIITADKVNRLHKGMTIDEVKAVMGPPMLANIFTPGRVDYIYTLQNPYQPRTRTQVTCLFVNHRLARVRYIS